MPPPSADDDLVIKVRPRVRPIQAIHYRHDGQDLFCLTDPTHLSDTQLHVSADVFMIASLLDGEHDCRDIQTEFMRRFQVLVKSEDIKRVVDSLDQAHLLEGPAFEEWKTALVGAFRSSSLRAPTMPGSCYPAEADEIGRFLDGFFDHEDGPGRPGEPPPDAKPLRALIAPHIDIRRGGVAFAHAYRTLAERPRPEVVVILGVAHAGEGELFTLTRKDFETPLGRVETDVPTVDRLAEAVGPAAFADEYAHKGEHSVEIQLVWLQHVWGGSPPRIAPVLTGSLAEFIAADDRSPRDDEAIGRVVAALAGIVAEGAGRVLLLASVDLAHIGRKFGDEHPLTPRLLKRNAEEDRKMLSFVADGDADGFFEFVRAEGDRRKICGLTPIYLALAACEKASGARARDHAPLCAVAGGGDAVVRELRGAGRRMTASEGDAMKIEVRRPAADEIDRMRSWETWGCEASAFPWEYDEKETCYILQGRARVEGRGKDAAVEPVEFGPGDVVVFPEGLQCTWIVTEPVRKHYRFGQA